MTQKEQARLQVLNSLLAEHMTLDQAATLMGVSARHTRRILAAYRREGAAALAHGNRGLRSTNATPEPLRSEVLRLAQTRYPDANHTHLSELLREREGIEIGRTTLRRILTGAGLKSPRRRRPPRHRVRRQRMPREGMLVQVDGSHHRWLGDDGPPFALLLAVDDATGIVVNALFCEQENTRDYFLLMRGLIQRYGVPIALYTDRHSVFKNVPGSGRAGAPLEQAYAAVLDMEVPKPPPLRPSIGTPDTVTVAVTFAPPDVEEIRRVADLSLFAQIEPLDQMRDFLEAVFAVKLQTTSTNRLGKPGVLTTMARLSQWALENGYLDSERGKDSSKG